MISSASLACLPLLIYFLDPRDVLIGSIALKNGYSVVTLNSKHFERIPALQVLEPEEIRF